MKILYWTDLYFPHVGGIEVFSDKLIPALQQRGHTVEIVTSHRRFDRPDYAIEKGIAIHRLHFWDALENRNVRQLIAARKRITQLKQTFQPDIVHLHYGATSYFHLNSLEACQASTLITIHSLPPASLRSGSILQRLLPKADWINTVSNQALTRLHKANPNVRSRSSPVYYGLNQPHLTVRPPAFKDIQILCLGRLVPQKGFDIALSAFANVIQNFPQAKLIIAGEGAERDALEQQAVDLDIMHSVNFRGLVSPEAVYQLLNETTLVLIPSRHEGLPLVAIQAAQMARPIISTDADGLPELIIDNVTGRIVKKEDVEGLATSIHECLTHPQKSSELGRSAQKRFQEMFSMDVCVDNYEMLYRKAIEQKDLKSPSLNIANAV